MKITPHWRMTGIVFFGLLISSGPVFNYTFGLFLIPISETLSWQRGSVSILFSSYLLMQALFLPFAGYLVDRFGASAIVRPSIAIFSVSLLLLGFFADQIVFFCALFVVLGISATGSASVPYAKVLTAWHEKRRGLALGIAASGTAVGAAIFPALAQSLIDMGGWRFAYICLGLMVLVVGLPVIAIFLRNTPQEMGLLPDGFEPHAQTASNVDKHGGLSIRQALCVPTFWILAIASVLSAAVILGTNIHLPSLLRDHGVSEQYVVLVASIVGVSSLFARIIIGWSLDQVNVSVIAIICFLSVALVCVLIALELTSGLWPFICAALLGFAIGAEVDIVAYATSRYFGQRNFSQIYGYLFAAFILGASIGPVLMGKGYDITGAYVAPLYVNAVLMVVSAVLMGLLGPYRYSQAMQNKG